MASGIDIGTLSGRIELEDNVSPSTVAIINKLDALEQRFESLGSRVAETAVGFFSATVALEAIKVGAEFAAEALKELTLGGAAAADVADNFERLTGNAGRLGETLLQTLREGTHATIDDLTLMKLVNSDLAAGMELTDQQFRDFADGAFALAQATGDDVTTALETMNDAMLTGRTRSLQMLTGKIDLTAAEDKFAASLGTVAEKLSAEEKLEAARLAIMESVTSATARLGEQTDGLDEKVAQLATQWANYKDQLGQAIATSPAVMHAFETIRDALVEAFGGDSQNMLETAVGWIDSIADSVSEYGPKVIDAFVQTKEWLVGAWEAISGAATEYGPIVVAALREVRDFILDVWTATTATWSALPDWFKEAAKGSVLLAGGLVAVGVGGKTAIDAFDQVINIGGNAITAMASWPTVMTNIGKEFSKFKDLLILADFSSLAGAGSSLRILANAAGAAIGPLGAVALAVGAIFIAWEIGKMEAVSDWFMNLGLMVQGYSAEERAAMIETDKLTQAMIAQSETAAAETEANAALSEQQVLLNETVRQLTEGTAAHNEVAQEHEEITRRTREEIAKQREAMEELKTAGTSYDETLKGIDASLIKVIEGHLKAGVSMNTLAAAYELTATQAKALNEVWQEEQKQIKETAKLWQEFATMQIEQGGTVLEQQIAKVEQWRTNTLAGIKQVGDEWKGMYDAVNAVADKALEGMMVDWDLLAQHSRQTLKDQADQAEATYRQALRNSSQYTSEFIDQLLKAWMAAENAVSQFGQTTEKVMQDASDAADRLGDKLDEVATKVKSGWTDAHGNPIDSITYTLGPGDPGYVDPKDPKNQNRGNMWDNGVPQFANGGIGDFGDGTLIEAHGKEAIIPLDRAGGFGGTNIFYVNGTATDVANKIATILMDKAKLNRRFGSI